MSDYKGNIIILSGYARSGKDTAGAYLVENYGLKRWAFATKLKEAAKLLTVWDKAEIDGNTEYVERHYWSGRDEDKRHPCVQLGKVMRDVVSPTIWVDAVINDPQFEQDVKEHGVVITDCRYMNEHRAIMDKALKWGAHFYCLWLERDVTPQGEELEKTTPLREMALLLRNQGDVSALYEQLDVILRHMKNATVSRQAA